jgi:putative transcriptional regulator
LAIKQIKIAGEQTMIENEEYKGKNGITYVFKKIPNIDGEYVKALRKKLGLSQAMFAALMKVSNKTVEKWEQGANPVTNGNAIAMVLFDKYPSLVETFIEIKDEIAEPDFSNVNVKEEIPQGLKLAKAK